MAAREFADRTGAVLIHPFDHPDVIAGQGTVGLEILDQCPDVGTIITAVGGGGLISGVAVAAKALRPEVRIIGVQATGAASYPPSLAAGAPVKLAECSHHRGRHRGAAARRPELRARHASWSTSSSRSPTRSSRAALLVLLERHKMVVEPAGGAAVAALIADKIELPGPVVAILSGGNIDPMLLLRVIEHGLVVGRAVPAAVGALRRPPGRAGPAAGRDRRAPGQRGGRRSTPGRTRG